MTDKTPRRRHRLAAAVGVVALSTAGLFGTTAAQATPAFGNFDPETIGSITVHKHERATAGSGAPDGSVAPTSPTIEGVTFEAYPIEGIDLSEATDWDGLSALGNLSSCDVPAPYTKGSAVSTEATDSNGIAMFDGLVVGAYLVCETDAPASVVDRAKPFVVTIPMPYEGGWIYNVHAYPKNGVTGIDKDVEAPNGLGLGATVKFPVTTDIPSVDPADSLTSYIVSDTLDNRLGSGTVESVKVDGTDVDASYYDVNASGSTIEVVFNADGLAWLKTQGGKQVVTVFAGVVTSVGDGEIKNTATVYVNDPSQTDGITSNPVKTNWGNVRIHKVDSASTSTGLAGAEFEVYEGTPAYAADCSTSTPSGSPVSVNGSTLFTSNTDGLVVVDGLFVSDTNTGDQAQRCYVLKETKAPAGFVTPEGDAALTPIAVVKGQTATSAYDATIKNKQQTVPELPLTGAAGQTLMVAGGIALITLGATLYMVRRRQAAKS